MQESSGFINKLPLGPIGDTTPPGGHSWNCTLGRPAYPERRPVGDLEIMSLMTMVMVMTDDGDSEGV